MKTNKIFIATSLIFLSSVLLYLIAQRFTGASGSSIINPKGEFPEEIVTILKNSCYDCHTSGTQNIMANFALDFKKWDQYKDEKKSQLLIKIDEEVSEKNMPPKKYLEGNPGKVLTDKQVELVTKWAKEEATSLSK